MRNAVMALAGLVFVVLAASAIFLTLNEPEGPVSPAAVNIAGAEIGGPFTLTDHTGAHAHCTIWRRGATQALAIAGGRFPGDLDCGAE